MPKCPGSEVFVHQQDRRGPTHNPGLRQIAGVENARIDNGRPNLQGLTMMDLSMMQCAMPRTNDRVAMLDSARAVRTPGRKCTHAAPSFA